MTPTHVLHHRRCILLEWHGTDGEYMGGNDMKFSQHYSLKMLFLMMTTIIITLVLTVLKCFYHPALNIPMQIHTADPRRNRNLIDNINNHKKNKVQKIFSLQVFLSSVSISHTFILWIIIQILPCKKGLTKYRFEDFESPRFVIPRTFYKSQNLHQPH